MRAQHGWSVALLAVSLIAGAAIFLQRAAAVAVRAEIGLLRGENRKLEQLRAENARLRQAQVSEAELRRLRGDHAALIRLRGEIETLKAHADAMRRAEK